MRGFGFAGIVALPLLLAGCGGGDTAVAGLAPCPRIAILAEGADLTRFREGAPRDLTAMVVDARIIGFDATCDYAGRERNAVEVRITPRFEAERGPAADSRSVDLPWFVAVSDPADSVTLERIPASTQVSFPANVARALATGRQVRLTVRAEEGTRIQEYPVRIAFQLTPDQLALNRQRGPR
ncbi:hypothetical protein DFH01_07865 [Falsiroseomonas bella]|uniref:Uncharacterized protein n=1 Tax=Falsiroseomonas bella TaxID=2184016 RepID=A0A317FJB0_9PROT|nr:hypothetical protein [Falsiroseomonas bella]PWS39141.1 hypothetical protein DFH01_07865 [Falsiroseomonas bella]